MPESFAEQVQAPDVTSCGGSRVFHIGWQGCGSLSPETIKLSPLYFCSGTTEGVLSSPAALVMMRFEAGLATLPCVQFKLKIVFAATVELWQVCACKVLRAHFACMFLLQMHVQHFKKAEL